MRAIPFCLAATAWIAGTTHAAAQERPLRTADPVPLPHGVVAVEAGVEYLEGVRFPLSGLEGDLLRIPSAAFRLGMGGIGEVQLTGGFDVLFIDRRGPGPFADQVTAEGQVTHDIFDPVVAFKLRLHEEGRVYPATGVRVATRLPSAGQASGLGTDAFDFLMWVLAGKNMGKTRVLGNVGFGVLSIPEQGDRQNDVLLYGLAASRPVSERWTLAGEVFGRVDTKLDTPVGTEDQAQARLGARWAGGGVTMDGALIAGLHETDPDLGVMVGLTWWHQAYP